MASYRLGRGGLTAAVVGTSVSEVRGSYGVIASWVLYLGAVSSRVAGSPFSFRPIVVRHRAAGQAAQRSSSSDLRFGIRRHRHAANRQSDKQILHHGAYPHKPRHWRAGHASNRLSPRRVPGDTSRDRPAPTACRLQAGATMPGFFSRRAEGPPISMEGGIRMTIVNRRLREQIRNWKIETRKRRSGNRQSKILNRKSERM